MYGSRDIDKKGQKGQKLPQKVKKPATFWFDLGYKLYANTILANLGSCPALLVLFPALFWAKWVK